MRKHAAHRCRRSPIGAWRRALAGAVLAASLAVAAEAASTPAEDAPVRSYRSILDGEVEAALHDLLVQMRRLPALAARAERTRENGAAFRHAVIAVDRSTASAGQVTAATRALDESLLQSTIRTWPWFTVVAAGPDVLDRAQYILGASLVQLDGNTTRGSFRIELALTDFGTSRVVARSSVRFVATDVDLQPFASRVTP